MSRRKDVLSELLSRASQKIFYSQDEIDRARLNVTSAETQPWCCTRSNLQSLFSTYKATMFQYCLIRQKMYQFCLVRQHKHRVEVGRFVRMYNHITTNENEGMNRWRWWQSRRQILRRGLGKARTKEHKRELVLEATVLESVVSRESNSIQKKPSQSTAKGTAASKQTNQDIKSKTL